MCSYRVHSFVPTTGLTCCLHCLLLSGMNTDEVDAQTFLNEYNSTAEEVWNAYTEASWKYNTDINSANKNAMVRSVIPT